MVWDKALLSRLIGLFSRSEERGQGRAQRVYRSATETLDGVPNEGYPLPTSANFWSPSAVCWSVFRFRTFTSGSATIHFVSPRCTNLANSLSIQANVHYKATDRSTEFVIRECNQEPSTVTSPF